MDEQSVKPPQRGKGRPVRLASPSQETRESSDSVDACPFCLCSLAGMSVKEYGDHLRRCMTQPVKSSASISSTKTTVTENCTELPSAKPSLSSALTELHICPCCEEVTLPARELDAHLQTCGVEIIATTSTATSSLINYTPSTPSLFSAAEIKSVVAPKVPRGPPKQTRITLKKLQKIDEETQVALALSASLVPQEPPTRRPKKNIARSRIKFSQPAPLLLERDSSESDKIIGDKVAAVVAQGGGEVAIEQSGVLPDSKIATDPDPYNDGIYTGNRRLWNLSRNKEKQDTDRFYVASLVPPISPKKPEEEIRMKHLSQIPGFRLPLDFSQKTIVNLIHHNPDLNDEKMPCHNAQAGIIGESIVEQTSSSFQDSASLHQAPIAPTITVGERLAESEESDDEDNRTLILCSSDDDVGQLEDIPGSPAVEHNNSALLIPNGDEEVRFASLSDKQLNQKLSKFGIKPLERAKAVAFLSAVDESRGKSKKQRKRKNADENGKDDSTSSSGKSVVVTKASKTRKDSKPRKTVAARQRKSKNRIVQLVSSDDEDTVDEETESVPESPSKSSSKPVKVTTVDDVHAVLDDYIRTHTNLYEQILQYQVVYLRPFLKKLKEDGYSVKAGLAMDYFDRHSIAFSQHNAEKPRPWGGSKTAKTK
ncbi:uncharacterized protein LOC129583928 [Paramacrobiotus metropolitanus]|uniref:uncharacterized protein LOC129583928 n=1 Tax=Paramacrobiotus metropolitanus TaxID=2943436 RepID=UPI002445C718|nr:uncharacterized protein LOC129583928 [Paramacrobiotus metropolitanus]